MRFEDLVDLEARLAVDEARDPTELQQRDREVFRRLAPTEDRRELVAGWLRVLRDTGQTPPLGRRVQQTFRLMTYALVVVGFGSGWGAAAGLLAFREDGPPVNVGTFWVLLVGVQIALVLSVMVALPLLRWSPGLPVLTDLHAVLRWLARGLQRAFSRADEWLSPEAQALRSRLRSRASLSASVQTWTAVIWTQAFGVAFNVGILMCCLRLVLFSDLAFGWSTTASTVDGNRVHRLVRGISTPWATWAPSAVPTLELVRATRYSRLDGRYFDAPEGERGRAEVVGGWWPFLVASVLTYGLLPRVVIGLLALFWRSRALARVPLDVAAIDQLVRRMTSPRVRTQAPSAPGPTPEPSRSTPSALDRGPTEGILIRYRIDTPEEDGIEAAIQQRLGITVSGHHRVRGVDLAADRQEMAAAATEAGALVVLAEAWEPPDKGVRRFLRELRETAGKQRPIWVTLIGATDGDAKVWKDRLALLEDPYLGVEVLAPS